MAANCVHYHLPDDDQFSLDFVNPERAEIDSRLERYDETAKVRVRTYDLDEEVHVIYAGTDVSEDAGDVREHIDEAFAEMGSETRVIVRELLEAFEGIQEQKQDEEGVPLDVYKDVELGRVPEALARVDWTGTIPEVAGRLTSNLILCHALPNANHRTAFVMLQTYLRAAEPTFEFPSLVTDDYEWEQWVDEYILDSKRLLTVRRNVGPFRFLARYGCETVRRKGDVHVPLSEYDLDLGPYEALAEYAGVHERRSVEFVETLLERTGQAELVVQPGIGESEFVDRLRRLD